MTNNICDLKLKNYSYDNFFIYNEFIFYIFLLKEYINLYSDFLKDIFKYIINLLNILLIKYLFFYKKIDLIDNFIIYYYQFKTLYSIYTYKQLLSKKQNIYQKIVVVKKISKTRKKGRIKKFKVIIIIGNKSGWFGLGSGKDFYLQDAISKARINAFKNIIYIPTSYSNNIKQNSILINKKNRKVFLFKTKNSLKKPKFSLFNTIFTFAGINNINSKIIGSRNIISIISDINKK